MNSKDFILALRKVIREEVQTAVRTEIKKLLSEERANINKAPITERTTVTTKVTNKIPAKKVIVNQAKKQYVGNPLLNDILNDTAGFPGEGPRAFLDESIGVNHIDYNDYSEWPTMKSKAPSLKSAPIPTVDLEGRPVNVNKLAETEAGQAVVQALTKDYSALMKAIDKKKGK